MPHTRAATLRALKETSGLHDVLQMQDSHTNASWADYSVWDLPPGLTYQPDALAWYPSDGAMTDQPPFYADDQLSTTAPADDLLGTNCEQSSNAEFHGLHQWYSTAPHESSSVSPVSMTRPRFSTSVFPPYESLILGKRNPLHDQTHAIQSWSTPISRDPSPISDGLRPRKASDTQSNDPYEEVEEVPSPSSAEESKRVIAAKADANKKRKIAHSVIEKNYRCRIKDGMAELRRCVPSANKVQLDGQGAKDVMSNHSSGKVATLSDAVRYVKELELQIAALHGQLDVMHRRNNTLQKIALSKVDMQTSPTTAEVEELEQEDMEWGGEVGKAAITPKQSKKSSPGRARDEVVGDVATHGSVEPQHQQHRSKAIAHSPSLRKRPEKVTQNMIGTLAAIQISRN